MPIKRTGSQRWIVPAVVLSLASIPGHYARVRIGQEVVLDPPITEANLVDGKVCWTSANATGTPQDAPPLTYIEAHFDHFSLGASCGLTISDNDGEEKEVYQPGQFASTGFWALPIFDETLCIAVSCTEKADLTNSTFVLDRAIVGATVQRDERKLSAETYRLRRRPIKEETPPAPDHRDLAVCGNPDFESAISYKNSFLASRKAMYETSRAVGYLIVGPWQCTGFLIGPHLMLTAKHCFDDASGDNYDPNAITQTSALFGREGSGMTNAQFNANTYQASEVLLRSVIEDWILFSLKPDASKGVPGERFGYFDVESNFLPKNTPIFIPQHPKGRYKEITSRDTSEPGEKCNINNRYGDRYYYLCDTQAGSSGAPVVDATTHKVIAVHTAAAGCGNWGNTGIATSSFDHLLTSMVQEDISQTEEIVETDAPTSVPTDGPTRSPTDSPTSQPTDAPTSRPTSGPTSRPTGMPTNGPTSIPTSSPTAYHSMAPTTVAPTSGPTSSPTGSPTTTPTSEPTLQPTSQPTNGPTSQPTSKPTDIPTNSPTTPRPTSSPTSAPTPLGGPTTAAPTEDWLAALIGGFSHSSDGD